MSTVIGWPKLYATRFENMKYGKIEPGCWRIFNCEPGAKEAPVGPLYVSKAELLGDLTRYCIEYGCEAPPVSERDRYYPFYPSGR